MEDAADKVDAVAVVVEVIKVEEDQAFTAKLQTMQPSINKIRQCIAGRMGDATITLWSVPAKHQGITTRPQGEIVCQD